MKTFFPQGLGEKKGPRIKRFRPPLTNLKPSALPSQTVKPSLASPTSRRSGLASFPLPRHVTSQRAPRTPLPGAVGGRWFMKIHPGFIPFFYDFFGPRDHRPRFSQGGKIFLFGDLFEI